MRRYPRQPAFRRLRYRAPRRPSRLLSRAYVPHVLGCVPRFARGRAWSSRGDRVTLRLLISDRRPVPGVHTPISGPLGPDRGAVFLAPRVAAGSPGQRRVRGNGTGCWAPRFPWLIPGRPLAKPTCCTGGSQGAPSFRRRVLVCSGPGSFSLPAAPRGRPSVQFLRPVGIVAPARCARASRCPLSPRLPRARIPPAVRPYPRARAEPATVWTAPWGGSGPAGTGGASPAFRGPTPAFLAGIRGAFCVVFRSSCPVVLWSGPLGHFPRQPDPSTNRSGAWVGASRRVASSLRGNTPAAHWGRCDPRHAPSAHGAAPSPPRRTTSLTGVGATEREARGVLSVCSWGSRTRRAGVNRSKRRKTLVDRCTTPIP